MGKETVEQIVNEATDALASGGTPNPPFSARARNPQMSRAKRAFKKCSKELEHRIKYGEVTQRSVTELVAQMASSVDQWSEGYNRWLESQD